MFRLSPSEQARVRQLLIESGLTFKPLLDELYDHAVSDIEEKIDSGETLESAMNSVLIELPENHFKHIQLETMETINKRFTLARMLSLATLALLFTSALFKMMHLAGAGWILLISLISLAASMTVSSVSGIYFNREKGGALRVLAIIAGTIIMLTGTAFKILHLAGADQIVTLGVTSLIFALLINTFHVYNKASGEGNLLTFLHEKYSPGIERFLLVLLFPFVVYRLITLLTVPAEYFANFVIVVVIYGAGLQLLALAWRHVENNPATKSPLALSMIILASITLTLPLLGNILPMSVRLVLIVVFAIAAALTVGILEKPRGVIQIFVYLIPIMFAVLSAANAGLIQKFGGGFVLNLVVIAVYTAGIFISEKNSMMRTLVIISLTSYLLES